jgi:hypothetical protein
VSACTKSKPASSGLNASLGSYSAGCSCKPDAFVGDQAMHVVCDKSPCTLLWHCDACNVKVGNFDESPGTKLETVTIFFLSRRTLVLLAYFERRR